MHDAQHSGTSGHGRGRYGEVLIVPAKLWSRDRRVVAACEHDDAEGATVILAWRLTAVSQRNGDADISG